MLNVQKICKSYNDKTILDGVSLAVNRGEIVALIGENGTGKTTLLKIILGEIQPDSGAVNLHGETVGYVAQELEESGDAVQAFSPDTPAWRIKYALGLVGLDTLKLSARTDKLSGGQRTRLSLARVLTHEPEPDYLLLDEPTNNLDSDGIKWLEQFISSYKGGILLVSHDRAFINKVADRVVEIERGTLKQYGGNYDFYKEQKAVEWQAAIDEYGKFADEKKRLSKLRNQKASQMQSVSGKKFDKIKYEDKMTIFSFNKDNSQKGLGRQLRSIDSRLQQLGEVEKPEKTKEYQVRIQGEPVARHKSIVKLIGIRKAYDRELFAGINFELRGNERVHLKGANGSGKTTLLKIIANVIKPDSGDIEVGAGVRVGYFSQDVDGLDYTLSGFANLQSVNNDSTAIYAQARSLGLLAEDLKRRPSQLSRGQQAKLGFAKLLLAANNLLILDEPTNHLDIATKERLESALQNYAGAILVASHDKYFLQAIGITATRHI